MPVISADLDLPTADLTEQVPAGVPVPVTLTFRHQSGATASLFTAASLEISYDGTTWTKVPLTRRGDGRYTAAINHPTTTSGHSPSLRLTASDAAGGTLTQEATNAYGVR